MVEVFALLRDLALLPYIIVLFPLMLCFVVHYFGTLGHMARASIRRATPFFQCHRTQQQIAKAAESNLVTINRVITCF